MGLIDPLFFSSQKRYSGTLTLYLCHVRGESAVYIGEGAVRGDKINLFALVESSHTQLLFSIGVRNLPTFRTF
jgi:acetyl-CoA carboxylase beta subunit